MIELKKYSIAGVFSLAVVLVSFLSGYFVSKDYNKPIITATPIPFAQNKLFQNETPENTTKQKIANNANPQTNSLVASELVLQASASDNNNIKISPETKMVYEYFYETDGQYEKTEEMPPVFLLNLDRESMEKFFVDWEILSFTPTEVVMRKTVQGNSNQHYVVGVHEGFIAVFYVAETNGTTLKEITDTPVESLSLEEQQRLASGILVTGNEELFKLLEDYGS